MSSFSRWTEGEASGGAAIERLVYLPTQAPISPEGP
jgi:hypothetical protein